MQRKKIQIIILLIFLVSSISLFANESPYLLKYRGDINDMDIYMEINVEGNNLTGFYYYTKYKEKIELRGAIEEYEKVVLNEYYNNELTGVFRGKFLSNKIEGLWVSPTGDNEYTFSMSLVSSEDIKELFYGRWEITKKITTGPIYAMDEEEINSLIGAEVVYKKKTFWFKHGRYMNYKYSNPEYKIQVLPELEFWYGSKGFFLESIGINKGLVITAEIYNNKKICINPASFFWIMDKNTLVTLWDGVYFELKRIQ